MSHAAEAGAFELCGKKLPLPLPLTCAVEEADLSFRAPACVCVCDTRSNQPASRLYLPTHRQKHKQQQQQQPSSEKRDRKHDEWKSSDEPIVSVCAGWLGKESGRPAKERNSSSPR